MANKPIFLIGLMGSGKSTVGRILSKKLSLQFIDSDDEIVKRNGVDIQTIFEIEGENGFRKREQEIIADLAKMNNLVIATGGGVVMRLTNRMQMANAGFVVYLDANIHTLFERVSKSNKRPMLQVDRPKQTLIDLHKVRDNLYRGLADKIIFTDNNKSASETASQIATFLKNSENT